MKKIKSMFIKLYKNQQGNVLVLVAGAMLMLFGFTAIVVDAGSLYFEKSRLQKILDAAVLGGAHGLTVAVNPEDAAIAIAKNILTENGVSATDLDSFNFNVDKTSIEIDKTNEKALTFARVMGFETANVYAIAKAELTGSLVRGDGIVPIGVVKEEFKKGSTYNLNLPKAQKGNYGYLALNDNKGSRELEDGIINGVEMSLSDTFKFKEDTEPGKKWGPVRQGFKDRLEGDPKHCGNWETADNSCKSIIIVPIVETFDEVHGRDYIKVIGFASFWVGMLAKEKNEKETTIVTVSKDGDNKPPKEEKGPKDDGDKGNGNDKHVIEGVFLSTVTSGEFKSGKPDFGVYGIKLVK